MGRRTGERGMGWANPGIEQGRGVLDIEGSPFCTGPWIYDCTYLGPSPHLASPSPSPLPLPPRSPSSLPSILEPATGIASLTARKKSPGAGAGMRQGTARWGIGGEGNGEGGKEKNETGNMMCLHGRIVLGQDNEFFPQDYIHAPVFPYPPFRPFFSPPPPLNDPTFPTPTEKIHRNISPPSLSPQHPARALRPKIADPDPIPARKNSGGKWCERLFPPCFFGGGGLERWWYVWVAWGGKG